jgi:nucleotide-binding universal stress UspA family protein
MTDPVAGSADAIATVVAAIDGSDFSLRVLPVASSLARRLGAKVDVVSVVDHDRDVAGRKDELAPAVGAVRRVNVSVVVDDDAARAIHNALANTPGAIACMASHGRGRSVAVVGSVATAVIAQYRQPVVMVGPSATVPDAPTSRVVACVDDSQAAVPLTSTALGWARKLGSSLTVLTVAEPVPASAGGAPMRRMFGPDEDVDAYLEALVRSEREEGAVIDTAVRWDPISPSEGVEDYLEENDAYLVVVSSHGRRGFQRLRMGSVAASIVRRSSRPVLVVPSAEGT